MREGSFDKDHHIEEGTEIFREVKMSSRVRECEREREREREREKERKREIVEGKMEKLAK